MSVRKVGPALVAVLAALLLLPVTAGAATKARTASVTSFQNVPVTGKGLNNGKRFSGHFNVQRFTTKNGKAYAVGTLKGWLGSRHINRSNVAIPIGVKRSGLAGTAANCPVLHLVLGPLNLNLLGLRVHLNQVVLDITAVSGPGNLLGNLLCDVANLLNQNPLAGQLSGLLTILQSLLSNPALLNL